MGEDFPYTSLCVVKDIKNKKTGILKRLADVENDEIQADFIFQNSIEKITNQNCNLKKNFIGVFGWQTEHSRYKIDTVSMRYSEKIPIEIFILQDCKNPADLRNILQSGIEFDFSTGRALIVYQVNDNIFCGVNCSKNDFETVNNKKKIKSVTLKFCEINSENFIQVEEKIFYAKLNFDDSVGEFYTENADSYIKNKIISRINQTTFKNNFSETDLQIIKDFIKNFSTADFYQEIATEYLISVHDAKKAVNEFVSANEEFLQAEFFDDEVLENILINSPKLLLQLLGLLQEQFEIENQEKISAVNSQLNEVQEKISVQEKFLDDLEIEFKNKRSQLEKIQSEINRRENFATEVENKIAERIEAAKKNASDFICEMAFINPTFESSQPVQNIFYHAGKNVEGNDTEIEDLQDFIATLVTEIGGEGVHNESIFAFATYLTAAYINKILLLLAGPNARDIADAFSVTLTGKTAAVFDCAEIKSFDNLKVIAENDDEVIAVLNPFAPNFIAYLPELVNIEGKFIFAIYPFAEDLKIEPRSFYNYFLPVFTELIIDRPPARDFRYKYFISDVLKQDFKKYNPDEMPISAEKKIKKLTETMEELLQSKKSAVLFADFPLAYVKGKEQNFIENFKGDEKFLEKMREFLGEGE